MIQGLGLALWLWFCLSKLLQEGATGILCERLGPLPGLNTFTFRGLMVALVGSLEFKMLQGKHHMHLCSPCRF